MDGVRRLTQMGQAELAFGFSGRRSILSQRVFSGQRESAASSARASAASFAFAT
jgi:hypothetical protein